MGAAIASATDESATAHMVDTDFTGENVRSYPATAVSSAGSLSHLSRQLPGIDRRPAMLGGEETPRATGSSAPAPDPRSAAARRPAGQPRC